MGAIHSTIQMIVNDQVVNPTAHTFALAGVLTALSGWATPFMTALATFLAIVWYAVNVYESKTFQSFMIRFRAHVARTLKHKGRKVQGQKIAESALKDAKAIVVVAKEDVVAAKETVADVQTVVDKK